MLKAIKIFLISYFFFLTSFFYSQTNLVPNGSFETYTACPNFAGQINRTTNWFSPSSATPDYFHACGSIPDGVNVPITFFGNSYARSGNAMAGFLLYEDVTGSMIYREYLAIKINSSLINNKKYYLTYNIKLSDSSRYASNSISVLFRPDSIAKNTNDTIDDTPQINNAITNFVSSKTNWTKMRGTLLASGTEKYMYIGNFKPDVTNDTLFVSGGGKKQYFNYPYYYIEDVCFSDDSMHCENLFLNINESISSEIKFYPNPAIDVFYIEGKDLSQIEIFDIIGNKINQELSIQESKYKLNLKALNSGIYILRYKDKETKQVLNYKLIKQ